MSLRRDPAKHAAAVLFKLTRDGQIGQRLCFGVGCRVSSVVSSPDCLGVMIFFGLGVRVSSEPQKVGT